MDGDTIRHVIEALAPILSTLAARQLGVWLGLGPRRRGFRGSW